MNTEELLQIEGIRVDTDLHQVISLFHCHSGQNYLECLKDTHQIHLRVIKDFCYDGRRIWYLAVVIFNSIPIAIIQRAGREGDDWEELHIIDRSKYIEACQYLDRLISYNDLPPKVDPDLDVTNFYYQSLSEPFVRD